MSIKATLLLLAIALCVALASARPLAFIGGSFYQARGHFSPGFGVFTDKPDDAANSKWARHESTAVEFDGPILDMYPVGEGVFAVGRFTNLGGHKDSAGVAFYDGTKWCAIRESIGGIATKKRGGPNGGYAVWCDSDTSCWVAGNFNSINNIDNDLNTEWQNFAHYTFDAVTSEWQYDPAVRSWNNNTAGNFPLEFNAVPGTLFGFTNRTDNQTYFFVGLGSIGGMTVFRGSTADNGWKQIGTTVSGVPVSNVKDFGFDTSVYPPILYTINSAGATPDQEEATPWFQELLLAPCTHANCDTYILQSAFTNFAFVPKQQNTNYIKDYYSIWSSNGTTYLIAQYDPDGTATAREPRWQVLKQVGDEDPQPLGLAFEQDTSQKIERVRGHPENKEWAYVIGQIVGANLFFPEGDNEGATTNDIETDRRSADRVTYVAQWRDLGRWEQALGGGFLEFTSTPSADQFPIVYNPNTQQWFVANTEITYTYDIQANGAAYYDNSPAAAQPSLFPVFTRALYKRPAQLDGSTSTGNPIDLVPANVYEFRCYADCQYVYVGGDFNFHGNDTIGAVAVVRVQESGEAEVQTVGGGLWYNDLNVVRDKPSDQFTAGSVYTMALEGEYLYVAGFFSRGKTGYVCLNNVARIRRDISTDSDAQWEDVGGGCNGEVYDLHVWEGRLYAAGAFEYCGNRKVNFAADYTYRSGSDAEWNNLNNGLNGVAYSLEAFGGRIIFAGEFSYAGGIPVSGVAAWNTAQWRPLLPACTDDCVPGSLQYYFNVLNSPKLVYNLKAAKDGNFLYARASFTPLPSSSSSISSAFTTDAFLARWEYFDGQDLGIWTIKGSQAEFVITPNHKKTNGVFVNNGTLIVTGGTVGDSALTRSNQDFHTWDDDSRGQNWLGTHLVIAPEIYVVRSSASSLASPLAFVLGFF